MRKFLLSFLIVVVAGLVLFVSLQTRTPELNGQPLAFREENAEPLQQHEPTPFDLPAATSPGGAGELPMPAWSPGQHPTKGFDHSNWTRETAGSVPARYAAPDRWRKTALPCWGLRGTAPEDFVVEVDSSVNTAGESSALLASSRQTAGWGILYQFASASDLRGKRIEFSADVRTDDVQRGANLFVRADDARGNAVAMDNMWFSYGEERSGDRLIQRNFVGDNDWTTHRIVIDIPVDAAAISYGVALDGPGKVWIDNAQLELATPDTAVTAMSMPAHLLQATPTFDPLNVLATPRNLHFEAESAGSGCE